MNKPSYAIDGSALLYLAQMGPDHTNVYRFTVCLTEPVQPELLQQAAQRICPRFPTILAGFRPGKFSYSVVPVTSLKVQADPGLLHTMLPEELERCAYRIYYGDCRIIIEAFHALTDGFGAVASLRALVGEYLFLRYGLHSPEREQLLSQEPDWEEELRDAYPEYRADAMGSLPMQPSYQLTAQNRTGQVHAHMAHLSTRELREVAKRTGVSVTTLLAELMAESIMELQLSRGAGKKPVGIMVPVDLRRTFPSKTFRNFILYALPVLTAEEAALPRRQRLLRFQEQLRAHLDRKLMQAQITRNEHLQRHICFRALPRSWKCALMRLSYRFFGERNSSITLTNLGPVELSAEMAGHVKWIEVYLTPRRGSPYNCALLSCGDTTCISITRFGTQTELEELFFRKLRGVMNE